MDEIGVVSSFNYTLKYKRFSELLADVRTDLEMYDAYGLVDPAQMIKVALLCIKDLGLRIYQLKEDVIDVENGRVALDPFFYSFNWGYLCNKKIVTTRTIRGIQTEHNILNQKLLHSKQNRLLDDCGNPIPKPLFDCCGHPIGLNNPIHPNTTNCNAIDNSCSLIINPIDNSDTGSTCCPNSQDTKSNLLFPPTRVVYSTCSGDLVEVVELSNNEMITFELVSPLILENKYADTTVDCPECNIKARQRESMTNLHKIRISNGWLYTNFKKGKIYISYYAIPNEDGELLVPDEPIINDYLEYAMKRRILENAIMSNIDRDVQDKFQIIEARYMDARVKAKSLVNMPNFRELQNLWRINRQAMYKRYFEVFK